MENDFIHLRDTELSLKAKGILSLMLSLPEDWDYTTKGLARICRDGVDSICSTVRELEDHGYIIRERVRNEKGQLTTVEYTILEQPVKGGPGTDGMMADREAYKQLVMENIEYAYLIQDMSLDRERIDELVELIVDTVCFSRRMIRIAGDDYPAQVVKSRFLKLDSSHIRYVLSSMADNTTYIRNIKKYLLAPCIMPRQP